MADSKLKSTTKKIVKNNSDVAIVEDVTKVESKVENKRRTQDKNVNGASIPDTFFVIKLGGKQEIVWDGLEMSVDKISEEQLANIQVLLSVEKDKVLFGNKNDKVEFKIEKVEDYLGEKVTTRVYKAKSRYHRTRGKRQHKSILKIKA